jgi:hypothetical protein
MFQTKFVEKLKTHILCSITFSEVGWDSIVGIAILYGLDGLGIKSWWGKIFYTCPDQPWGPSNLLYNGYCVIPRGKATGV